MLLTPEHFQLFSTRRLTESAEPQAEADETSPSIARMAHFEMRRRAGEVPVRHRYSSVHVRSLTKQKD
jgi:hypothetical protein